MRKNAKKCVSSQFVTEFDLLTIFYLASKTFENDNFGGKLTVIALYIYTLCIYLLNMHNDMYQKVVHDILYPCQYLVYIVLYVCNITI